MRIHAIGPTFAALAAVVIACAAPSVKTSKLVGQELPVGALVDVESLPVGTGSLAADGPAVVVFYRGHWCPDCRKQLGELQQRHAELTAAGARVVGISVDPPQASITLAKELALPFALMQDPNGEWIRALGLWDPSREVARPTTLVLARGGRVTWAYVGRDKADRPTVDQILAAITSSASTPKPASQPASTTTP